MRPAPSETAGWYKVPSVTRLLKYDNPIPMAGDPPWKPIDVNACKWAARETAVYSHMMKNKCN
jgi:hypothetical protein